MTPEELLKEEFGETYGSPERVLRVIHKAVNQAEKERDDLQKKMKQVDSALVYRAKRIQKLEKELDLERKGQSIDKLALRDRVKRLQEVLKQVWDTVIPDKHKDHLVYKAVEKIMLELEGKEIW